MKQIQVQVPRKGNLKALAFSELCLFQEEYP